MSYISGRLESPVVLRKTASTSNVRLYSIPKVYVVFENAIFQLEEHRNLNSPSTGIRVELAVSIGGQSIPLN